MKAHNPWLCGECSVFAVALQKRFGGELFAVYNHSRVHPTEDNLEHAYCVIDGIAYDANGPNSLKDASDVSGFEVPEMDKELEVEFVWRKTSIEDFERLHEDYDEDRIEEAEEYIDEHPELFPKAAVPNN